MALGSRVILISVDNLRADCVSANPDKSALADYDLGPGPQTPTLDRLAEGGAAFFNCFSAASYTTASHASLLTGLFPVRHGIREYYRHSLAQSATTLCEWFKAAGYVTVLATDFPFLLGPNLGFTRGVDHFIMEDDAQVFQLLNSYQEQRVFAFVHFGSVHNPFGLTSLEVDGHHFLEQVERLGDKMGVPKQLKLQQEWIEGPRSTQERLLRQRYFACTDLMYRQGQYHELMQLYVEGIEYFDAHRFKKFIDGLEHAGWLDGAILALVSDHGEEYSERAFAHYNGLWEGIIKVPLIVIGPQVPKGLMADMLCRTVDIAPTLLELAGLDAVIMENGKLDGVSLMPFLRTGRGPELTAYGETWFGKTKEILDFMELCRNSGRLLKAKTMAATHVEYVRTSRWKLMLTSHLEPGNQTGQLFAMPQDPLEKNDLARVFPQTTAEMLREIETRRGEVIGQELLLEAKTLRELAGGLQDLGYLRGKTEP